LTQPGFSRNRSIEPSSLVMRCRTPAVLDGGQPDGGHRPGLVERHDPGEVDVGQHVAGDDQEALVQLVHGVADGPGRAERVSSVA